MKNPSLKIKFSFKESYTHYYYSGESNVTNFLMNTAELFVA